jgi:hypothetical protein
MIIYGSQEKLEREYILPSFGIISSFLNTDDKSIKFYSVTKVSEPTLRVHGKSEYA